MTQPALKTFQIMVDGVQQEAKAFSLNALKEEYSIMGYDGDDFKVLGEITPKGPQPIQENPGALNQPEGNMNMIDVNDLPEMVRDQVANNIQNQPANPAPVHGALNRMQPTQTPEPETKSMHWKDGDVEFKLEGGKLYKKAWNKISLKKLEEDHDIKVKFKRDSGKVSVSEYTVEIMQWVEVEQK
jgi:hypothetical protein